MPEPISAITPLLGARAAEATQLKPATAQGGTQSPSFGAVLQRAITGLDQVAKAGDSAAEVYAAGADVELHDVMIAMQEAQISFELASQVRSKAVEAYQEIMRMQL